MNYFLFAVVSVSGIYIIYKDLKERIIPNWINMMLLLIGIGVTVYTGDYLSHLIGFALLGTVMLLLAVITGGFGLGDVKYIYASGMLLGFQTAGYGLVIGIMLGGLGSAFLLITKKLNRKDYIAYGPYLVMGNILAILI